MGIFSTIVGLPFAPVRGVIALGEVIARQAEQTLNDPARIRRQLEELELARERGEISAEEENEAQRQILEAKMRPASGDQKNG